MHLLEVSQVSKHYAGHTALNQVSLNVPENSIYGLLGPNGAGKTSLIRIITQITGADEGEVRFAGQPLQPQHTLQIGYLPEERGLYRKMKVGEQLVYLARLKDLPPAEAKTRVKAWLERLELAAWWNRNLEDLSKGMQQKVQFIASVLHRPKLIILDEPFSGFDPVNAAIIRDEILELRRQGSTIIFSTHRMETVEELCDHVALINRSRKVLEGRKTDIKNQYKTHTYTLLTRAPVAHLAPSCELLASQPGPEGTTEQQIRIGEGGPNALLATTLAQTEVLGFHENLPSMHDIFIRLVKE
ncbi:MAG: ABC transporter ATP-binding protein [Bernardetiaceae bacterium]|jgi:ABC-2 type transport system ATP-binding protein|nr:ABC transporter ATP-binding protein [Bernardetiaceae bacterium]